MLLFTVTLWSQSLTPELQGAKAQLYAVWDLKVHPSKSMEYEAAVKEMKDLYIKYKCPFAWNVYKTNDFHYYFLIRIANLTALDDFFNFAGKVETKAQKEMNALTKRFADTFESETIGTFYLREDISYQPEKPRLKSEDTDFVWWDFYYIKSGYWPEYEKVCRKWQSLYKSKDISDGYSVWVAHIWSNIPVYVVSGMGKNTADYHMNRENNMKKFAGEYQTLANETMSLCRKVEHRTGHWLKDLSYNPDK
jgi:hypothetical protein